MNRLAMGIYDDLDRQTQPLLYVDATANNMIVFGGHRSGKTTFLKTLLVRMHECLDADREQDVYILDFGGNLGSYRDLPLVAACFDNSNAENIRRVFRAIEHKLEQNKKILASRQFGDVYHSGDAEGLAHILLMIDNVNAFLADERYTSYHEMLSQLCREGLSRGLTLVFTAADFSGGVGRLLNSFDRRFALEGSADKYIDIFGMRVGEPMSNAGRGVSIIDGKPRELQIFLPFRDEERDLPMLRDYLAQLPVKTEKLTAFDGDLTMENFRDFLAKDVTALPPKNPVVGLDYYDHRPVVVNLREVHSLAIYGKKKFGKTNLLRLLVRSIRGAYPDFRFVFFDDGRRQLKDICNEAPSRGDYLTSVEAVSDYLDQNGFAAKIDRGVLNRSFTEKPHGGTVFVLQSKMLYQANGAQLLKNVFPKMIAAAEEKNYWFIFSDVRKIGNNDRDTESSLNNSIAAAFLLDNIAEFVTDRGSRSVFGEMDAKELKNEYARCELGDGYYFDIESDELHKLKIIKV
ncbi:MAG: hypothetical protein IJ598_01175 [Ruminococcus sp.]|nr:hypothetical protein [Ruminococcus sp.]